MPNEPPITPEELREWKQLYSMIPSDKIFSRDNVLKYQGGCDEFALRLIHAYADLQAQAGSRDVEAGQSFQSEVTAWADKTFPGSTDKSKLEKLINEEDELEFAVSHGEPQGIAEEAADCYLILLHLCGAHGIDLQAEARRKHEINKTRKWGEPDKDGVVEHVRELAAPANQPTEDNRNFATTSLSFRVTPWHHEHEILEKLCVSYGLCKSDMIGKLLEAERDRMERYRKINDAPANQPGGEEKE